MVVPLASVSIWKVLSKLGKAKTSFSVIFFFNNLKPLSVASVHLNGCLLSLIVSTMGAQI